MRRVITVVHPTMRNVNDVHIPLSGMTDRLVYILQNSGVCPYVAPLFSESITYEQSLSVINGRIVSHTGSYSLGYCQKG